MAMTPAERAKACRDRKRGGPPRPKQGYQQALEHVAKRLRAGDAHYRWSGDNVSVNGGRKRARKAFPLVGPCVACGAERAERHHVDGNTANNASENIAILCRRCHMEADGRMDAARQMAKRNQPKAVKARW